MRALAAAVQPKALLMADRQQLVVLQRRKPRPRLGSGPAVLDFGVSVVQRLANLSPRSKTRNGAALAPTGLAHVLAPAFTPHRAARPLPHCGGTSDPYPPNDHGEPTVGSVEDPGVLHAHVTPNPTAWWAAQQIVECCAFDRKPPRFLVHDRDSCFFTTLDRRVRNIGIAQVPRSSRRAR